MIIRKVLRHPYVLLAPACLAPAVSAGSCTEAHLLSIPAGDAATSLTEFSVQAGVALLVNDSEVAGIRTNSLAGSLPPTAALQQLLGGTPLSFTFDAAHCQVEIERTAKPPAIPPPDPPPQAPAVPVEVLESVVVTAQRRPEDSQAVPESIRVITGATLASQGLRSLNDVSELMPDIHVSDNSRSWNVYLRGVGSAESQAFQQSVGVFKDDVYHGRGRMLGEGFLDLDHIEVLKGPQTALYGYNTIGGAFVVVSRKPGDDPEGSLRLLSGSHGRYAAEGVLSGPVTESLSARLAVIADGIGGWLHDEAIGRDVPAENNLGARLTLRLRPDADFDASLKVEASQHRNIGALALQDEGCPPPAPFPTTGFCQIALTTGEPIGLGTNEIAQGGGQEIRLTTGEAVLTLQLHHWGQTFTSVTGAAHYHFNENEGASGTAQPLFNIQAPEKYWQVSQELRAASPVGQTLEYLAGVYFQADRLDYTHDNSYFFLTPQLSSNPSLAPLTPYLPLGQDLQFSQPEKSYSTFASGTWHMTEHWSATAGLRATWVRSRYDWSLRYGTAAAPYGDIQPLPAAIDPLARAVAAKAGLGVAGSLQGERTDKGVMPSARLEYLHGSKLLYASFTRGWKAGGFNANDTSAVAANLPFSPEHVDAYEAGFKSEWFGHRLRFNLDAFRSDYTDLQVATNVATPSGAILSQVRNAASSRTQGGELELAWVPAANWHLSANATYDEARYLRYPGVAPTQLQQLLGQTTQDLSGRPTEFAPKWTGSLTLTHTLPLAGDRRLASSITGIGSSSFFLSGNDDPTLEQPAYARLDARLSLGTRDERWELDLLGRNLTNQSIQTFAVNWPTSPGGTWIKKVEPRSWAAQLVVHR